jgi:hypothetical protein
MLTRNLFAAILCLIPTCAVAQTDTGPAPGVAATRVVCTRWDADGTVAVMNHCRGMSFPRVSPAPAQEPPRAIAGRPGSLPRPGSSPRCHLPATQPHHSSSCKPHASQVM